MEALNEEEVARALEKIVLYPNRRGTNSVRIEGGPLCMLHWGHDGLTFDVAFRSGKTLHIKPETVASGKSQWLRDQTHRLSPEFVKKLARAIANNPEGRSTTERVAARYLRAMEGEVRDVLREEPYMLDATRLLKPRTLALLGERAAVYHYRNARAWELRAPNEAVAQKLLKVGQADLIGKTKLSASDPFLHHLAFYVSYPGGYLEAGGLEEKKRNTQVLDDKTAILRKGQEVFGKAGVKLTGSDGDYTLKLIPASRELRGKFRATEISAPTLAEISAHLDRAIAKIREIL